MHPDLWPSLDSVIVDPDICIRSASQLEGEQIIDLPSVGSELHAAPSAPQNSSSSLLPSPSILSPLDTPAYKNLSRGEGATTKQCATGVHHPKPQKLPDLHIEVLEKSGGVFSALGNAPVILEGPDPHGHACTVVDTNAKEVKPSCVDRHERGGVLPVVGTTPALAEGTTSVEPADKAVTAVAAKPEALVPWAQYKAGHRCKVKTPPQEGKGQLNVLPLQGKCMVKAMLPQGKDDHEHSTTLQGVAKHKVKRLPQEGKHKANEPQHKALLQKRKCNAEALS